MSWHTVVAAQQRRRLREGTRQLMRAGGQIYIMPAAPLSPRAHAPVVAAAIHQHRPSRQAAIHNAVTTQPSGRTGGGGGDPPAQAQQAGNDFAHGNVAVAPGAQLHEADPEGRM